MKIKALSDPFTKNIGWKAVSLLIAVALWFICMNIINPLLKDTVPVSLEIIGSSVVSENDYIILNQNELSSRKINVVVQATRKDLSNLKRDSSALRAYIDLRPVDISQTNRIGTPMSVSVKCEASLVESMQVYTVTSYSPMSVDVILDRLVTESMPITVERLRAPKDGYIAMDAVVTPNTVNVTGAQSLVETIDSIGVSVNIENVTSSVDIEGEELIVFDNTGKDITSQLNLSVDKVNISVPVMKYARIPIKSPTFSGEPADGYNLALPVKWEPQYLEVVGDAESIDSLAEINLNTIDLTGWTESQAVKFELNGYLSGLNMSIRNGTPSSATVYVAIEQEIEKEIEVPLANLRYTGMSSSFELPPGNIKLRVRGTEAVISGVIGERVHGNVDLTGLEPGAHRVPVEFILPDGVEQVQPEVNIDVSVFAEEDFAGEDLAGELVEEHADSGEGSDMGFNMGYNMEARSPDTETNANENTDV